MPSRVARARHASGVYSLVILASVANVRRLTGSWSSRTMSRPRPKLAHISPERCQWEMLSFGRYVPVATL